MTTVEGWDLFTGIHVELWFIRDWSSVFSDRIESLGNGLYKITFGGGDGTMADRLWSSNYHAGLFIDEFSPPLVWATPEEYKQKRAFKQVNADGLTVLYFEARLPVGHIIPWVGDKIRINVVMPR